MAQFTIYRSTDGSAPTLSGTAGDLTNLLDKCLVDGYGSQSGAGWTKPQTGTNRRAYKNGTGSTGLLWRVRDDAGGTGGAKEALIRGAESMSDVNTLTNPFPTSGQISNTDNSLIIRKSATADATTRAWIVVADAKTCYVFLATGDQANTYYGHAFGDGYSLVSGDAWHGLVNARSSENSATATASNSGGLNGDLDCCSSTGTNAPGIYLARNHSGAVGSTQYSRVGAFGLNVMGQGTNAFTYPNPADNSIYLSRVFICSSLVLRGYFRGLWYWLHAGGANDGDTFNGSGDLAGKTFLVIKNSQAQGFFVIETSNTLP